MQQAIVIGAGIVGLATARALAREGYQVKVFERHPRAAGASVRNFGMVWPIGQPAGALYNRAIRSRDIWKEIGDTGAFWYRQTGSLHLAYNNHEWAVLEELNSLMGKERHLRLLGSKQVQDLSPAVRPEGLLGGLYSPDEVIVDPRQAIAALPGWLQENYGVQFHWNKAVRHIQDGQVFIGEAERYAADLVLVCNGADFETLYPDLFRQLPITKCKLQMMRLESQPGNWQIGPALCGGLSLIHYKSFAAAASLAELKKRYEAELPAYLHWGIHVMVSQNGSGELTIGDTHEYGLDPDPFDKTFLNQMVMDYLRRFAQFPSWTPVETWHGIYAKCQNGDTELVHSPEAGVYLVNGLGGAGMTLSFGLAEEWVAGW